MKKLNLNYNMTYHAEKCIKGYVAASMGNFAHRGM